MAKKDTPNKIIESIKIPTELHATAQRTIDALGKSPVELKKSKVSKIKDIFPIPREQKILWADAEFDLRPSGIVCTDEGVFIKTNVDVVAKKVKNKEGKKEKVKSQLLYYKWEDFEPSWFISDDIEENKVLSVEPQCREVFINGCKALVASEIEETEEDYTNTVSYSISDDDFSKLIAKIVPIEMSGMQTAEKALFQENTAAVKTNGGHGVMAEEAINIIDRMLGYDAIVVGRNNAKDGADRIVEGMFIQTKYCNSPIASCDSAFSTETGLYRYMCGEKPMQLEVPKDQYEAVVARFEMKIKQGKVPGVDDPKKARMIVKKGRLTYQRAVNLTKPGTIESLAYDAATGAVMCSCAFGLTFVVTVFLTWRRTGDIKEAVKAGVSAGIQVFGISFLQHMVVSQIARTNLAKALMNPSKIVVEKLGYKVSATIVNGFRALSGKSALSGAAASKHLAKVLRGNVVTSALTFAVFSLPETYKVAAKKISVAQYAKNMTVLIGSIAGGAGGVVAAGVVAGKVAGAVGTAVAPGVGTAVGIVGGFVGGMIGSKAVDIVGDALREDDVEIIGRLFNAVVSCLIGEYLLDATEMDKLIAKLDEIPQKEFKSLFGNILKAEKQEETIRDFLTPYFDAVINEREPFALPSGETILEAMVEDCAE